MLSCDKDVDYVLYEPAFEPGFEPIDKFTFQIGDSKKLEIGDSVTIVGYPDYNDGDSVYSEKCTITGRKKHFFGAEFFRVSGRIVHGMSGGVVLNKDHEIVGIIKGGVIDINDSGNNVDQGFVPIHLVLEDINSKKADCISPFAVV